MDEKLLNWSYIALQHASHLRTNENTFKNIQNMTVINLLSTSLKENNITIDMYYEMMTHSPMPMCLSKLEDSKNKIKEITFEVSKLQTQSLSFYENALTVHRSFNADHYFALLAHHIFESVPNL
jgi:hypothetical protein